MTAFWHQSDPLYSSAIGVFATSSYHERLDGEIEGCVRRGKQCSTSLASLSERSKCPFTGE